MGAFESQYPELPHDLPERLGDEALDLLVPVHQQLQRRALDPPYGHEVLAHLSGGQRDEPREHCAPGEVDDLSRLRGVSKLLVGIGQVGEGVLHLPFREGAELCPADLLEVGTGLADRLHADQLPFPVVVGRDDYLVRLRRQVLDHVQDGLHPDRLDLRGVD